MNTACRNRAMKAATWAVVTGFVALGAVGVGRADHERAGEDRVVLALRQALHSYECGDLAAAQMWASLASKLLDSSNPPACRGNCWPQANASQLLDVLGIYEHFAHGRRADLDRQFDALLPWLGAIEALNMDERHPDHYDDRAVDYDPFTSLARRIGDVAVDYDPFTRQIRRVGDIAIDYNPFTEKPRRIGDIEVDWDPFDGSMRRIGGVSLH